MHWYVDSIWIKTFEIYIQGGLLNKECMVYWNVIIKKNGGHVAIRFIKGIFNHCHSFHCYFHGNNENNLA